MKYYRFDVDYILWGISFTNLNMLLCSIPEYEIEEDGKGGKEKVVYGGDDITGFFENLM